MRLNNETSRRPSATNTASALRATAIPITGVPASGVLDDKELDELDRLHRDIAARLERIKSQQ
ncbi:MULTISPECIES: hypothetical protein [Bradyrhizobium]|uniref:hypothetical protein n=1 Tax=Bradyrhizobium TaxID=374 RepID=UPI00158DABAF|nr:MULTISPECIES: hypothetical protein [Bradyrhizobium]MCC8937482.1 hypothetical protein [Bradyrhizobium ivorense]